MSTTQSELTLARKIEERSQTTALHESVLAAIESSDDKTPNDAQRQQLKAYRERAILLDEEIGDLTETIESNRKAFEASKAVRRVLAGNASGVEVDGDQVAYRDFYTYARDQVLTSSKSLAKQWANENELNVMRERLQLAKRIPANTLSSDVGGLIPEQHIAQIFQVINRSRPLVDSARRVGLERGSITYPVVVQRPVVAVQSAEKTEAGNQKMIINMATATATTYLGGGDISWQAINWSTPDALEMWFDLAAEDYAIKTELDAASVLSSSAFANNIDAGLLGATPTFTEFMAAVGAGGAEVYDNSGRMANTVYMAPDRWWFLFGTTSDAQAMFANVNVEGVGPLRFVATPGLNAGEIIVGDRNGLLVAETPDAPVELRAVEPAIGGVEVGIIGAFEAVVVDNGAFSAITTAS
jgi:hypothetical protein